MTGSVIGKHHSGRKLALVDRSSQAEDIKSQILRDLEVKPAALLGVNERLDLTHLRASKIDPPRKGEWVR